MTGPDGRVWTVRERWMPSLGRLAADPAIDSRPRPGFSPLQLALAPLALAVVAARVLAVLPQALFEWVFLPPRIEAVHEGPPYSKLAWRAANRQVGPRLIQEIAAAIERGDRRILVEGAVFLGFSSRRS